jgi:hypothetical protein
MSRSLVRLLRVRRLMEDMSRAGFAERKMEQVEMEERRDVAHETALALRGEARAVLGTVEVPAPGVWQRLLADGEASEGLRMLWDRAAREAVARAAEAERKYMEDRRSRMQAEIVVRERVAAERLEQERREQREIDEWFAMRRGVRLQRARSENSPI